MTASDSKPPTSAGLGAGVGGPVERQHASDHVFNDIASAILRRELAPNSPLPPERELSERFGVSRIVVREAIHRLKEYELVRVRQGSPTIVLDPDDATDIRLLGLEIELVSDGEGIRAVIERQSYAASSVLGLAEQRMDTDAIDALEKITDEFLALDDKEQQQDEYERRFWVAVARGSGNRIYIRETIWWMNLVRRDPRYQSHLRGDPEPRWRLYKAVTQTLRQGKGSAELFLNALRSLPISEG